MFTESNTVEQMILDAAMKRDSVGWVEERNPAFVMVRASTGVWLNLTASSHAGIRSTHPSLRMGYTGRLKTSPLQLYMPHF